MPKVVTSKKTISKPTAEKKVVAKTKSKKMTPKAIVTPVKQKNVFTSTLLAGIAVIILVSGLVLALGMSKRAQNFPVTVMPRPHKSNTAVLGKKETTPSDVQDESRDGKATSNAPLTVNTPVNKANLTPNTTSSRIAQPTYSTNQGLTPAPALQTSSTPVVTTTDPTPVHSVPTPPVSSSANNAPTVPTPPPATPQPLFEAVHKLVQVTLSNLTGIL